jgi:hypothetical protein
MEVEIIYLNICGKLFETKEVGSNGKKANCLMEMGRIINSRGNSDVMMMSDDCTGLSLKSGMDDVMDEWMSAYLINSLYLSIILFQLNITLFLDFLANS